MATLKPQSKQPPPQRIELNLTLDIGPHLSHLFKRFFPKLSQQPEVDALTEKLHGSEMQLEEATKNAKG